MNFNKTTSYSLRVLSYMAGNEKSMMSSSHLYKNLNIPYSYLRQVLGDLSRSGFIKSVKGRNGGFFLSKEIGEIYLADIIKTTEGLDSFERCIMGFDVCPFNNECPMHGLWIKVKTEILNALKNTSLADLVNK